MMPIGDDDSDRTVTPLVNHLTDPREHRGVRAAAGDDGSQAGGVAKAAHVGGFVAGLVLVKTLAPGQVPR